MRKYRGASRQLVQLGGGEGDGNRQLIPEDRKMPDHTGCMGSARR